MLAAPTLGWDVASGRSTSATQGGSRPLLPRSRVPARSPYRRHPADGHRGCRPAPELPPCRAARDRAGRAADQHPRPGRPAGSAASSTRYVLPKGSSRGRAIRAACPNQRRNNWKVTGSDMTAAMTAPSTPTDRLRPRRSCLAVPGSNPRFLEKAQGLPADQVFLDLEDSVAPLVKQSARQMVVDALNNGDWGGKIRVVRVNDWTTQWTYRDVVTVVEGAGASLDCVMLPKVADDVQVKALD